MIGRLANLAEFENCCLAKEIHQQHNHHTSQVVVIIDGRIGTFKVLYALCRLEKIVIK